MGDARRGVMLERRRIGAAQRADDPGEQHGQRVAAGVDDARLAQHGQQVGPALDRLLAGVERPLDHLGDHRVLLVVGRPRARAARPACARARRRRASAISRTTVRIVPSAGSRTEPYAWSAARASAAPISTGSTSSPGRLASSSAAPRISCERITPELPRAPSSAARATEADDLVAADVVDRALLGGAGEPVELLQHGAQREHHVVAGVAVGDREHVQVVDLLAARLERREAGLDDRAEANDARIGHRSPIDRAGGMRTRLSEP